MVKVAGSMEWLNYRRAGQTLVAVVLIWSLAGLGRVHGRFNSSTGALISCVPNPCQNGGICETDAKTQTKSCRCGESHVGKFCQHRNPCYTGSEVTRRCLNKGTCQVQFALNSFVTTDVKPDFKCQCRVGFSASLCEIPLPNACDASPCQNSGTCSLKTLTDFTCACRRGYRGVTCGQVDFCASSPCKNSAKCVSSDTGYSCQCAPGFQGLTCLLDIDECSAGNICSNAGTCVNTVGSYRCSCPRGYTGQNCDALHVPCSPNHCKNGGRCIRDQDDRYLATCDCPPGFSGKTCETNIDNCVGHQCQNGATCVDGINAYSCQCPASYMGVYCTEDVDECSQLPQPCKNGATCQNSRGGYSCICVNGWQGKHCDQNIDDCTALVCLHGGTCHDRVSSYYCECPPGRTGLVCQLEDACASNPCHAGADCDTNPIDGSSKCTCPPGFGGSDCSEDLNECELSHDLCEHGGRCNNTIGSFRCDCAKGYTGTRCEHNINECASNPCQNDGTCLDERGAYRCVCMPGFTGINCQTDMDECSNRPCQNGGVCRDVVNGFQCTCPIGFSGPTCSASVSECTVNPCRNGGKCHDGGGSAPITCLCPSGFGGRLCEENKMFNQCASSPCQSGGICVDDYHGYSCQCQAGYSGRSCQCPPGEKCGKNDDRWTDMQEIPDSTRRISLEEEKAQSPSLRTSDIVCPVADCAEKAKNKRCDEECNRIECGNDGLECSVDPWANCTLKTKAPCSHYFHNGRCDPDCNIRECLFDGFDCGTPVPIGRCEPDFDTSYGAGNFCMNNYGNGRCDHICNNSQCYFDGLDCSQEQAKLLDGTLIVIVRVPPEKFHMVSAHFLQKLGRALRSVAQIQKDKDGHDLITRWTLSGGIAINPSDDTSTETVGTAIFLQLDNRQCRADCLETVEAASGYLTAAQKQGTLDLGVPLYSVQTQGQASGILGTDERNNNLYWLLIIALVALVAVAAIVTTINNKRKRVNAVTWFPEGFIKSTSTAVLSEHLAFPSSEFSKKTSYDNRAEASTIGSYYDSDTELQQPSAKRIRGTTEEPRGFTQQHHDMRGKPADIFALTPPSQDEMSMDVNVKGPGGMTPLMLAAMRGSGLDTCEDEHDLQPNASDDEVAHMIQDLLMHGSKLDEASDVNGETALHFAARCARAAVVKLLLDNGADVTLRDHNGRTALHSAVAAGSSSVLAVLKMHRKVDWNARMSDGTTPLILAVRLVINDFVDEILKHDVDINSADDNGRTALHWGAAVNNHQGVKQLLHRQAKVDIQDEAAETPLFLAAKEGNYEAARELLEFRANMELPNDMDKTPRDVACLNRHSNLVRLLDEQKDVVHSPQQNLSKNMFYTTHQSVHLPTIARYSKPGRNKAYFNSLTGGAPDMMQSQKKNTANYRRRTPLDMCQMQGLNLPPGFDLSKPPVNYMESTGYNLGPQYPPPKMDLCFAGDWKPESLLALGGGGGTCPSQTQHAHYGQMQQQSAMGMYGKYSMTSPTGYNAAAPSPAMTLHSNDQAYVSNMSSSPDSPGQWSSSPHSEWSDGTGMPSPKAMMTRMNSGHPAQAQQSYQYVSSTIGDAGHPLFL